MKKDCLLCSVSSPFSQRIERFNTMNYLNKSSINRAVMPLSLVTLLTTAIIMFIEMLIPNLTLQEIDIALIFGTLILTFGFSMFFYDKPVDEMEVAPWRS